MSNYVHLNSTKSCLFAWSINHETQCMIIFTRADSALMSVGDESIIFGQISILLIRFFGPMFNTGLMFIESF